MLEGDVPLPAAVLKKSCLDHNIDWMRRFTELTGMPPQMVWHGETDVPDVDLVVLPGGFSYGDYLRCGAMAAQSRIMRDVKKKADDQSSAYEEDEDPTGARRGSDVRQRRRLFGWLAFRDRHLLLFSSLQ